MTDVTVPKWGLTMDDAVMSQWLKDVGEHVAEGEPIAVIETDKAQGDLPSPVSGVLVERLVAEGDTVEPGEVVARVEDR